MHQAAADLFSRVAADAADCRGVFRVALSGGKTPEALFRLLSQHSFKLLPWEMTEVYWVDERYVPPDHAESNYRLARELLLERVPIPPDCVHAMPTGSGDPPRDAAAYETILRAAFPGEAWPVFDLALLGLGEDGHTASLFPSQPELSEKVRWVVASRSPKGIPDRITLTVPAIDHARSVVFLVSGAAKATVFREVYSAVQPRADLPATFIRPAAGRLLFLADQAATQPAPPSL